MIQAASIWSGQFWKATAERAIWTAAQAGLAYLGMGALNVIEINWQALGGIAGGGALIALLKSLSANAITKNGPGTTNAEHVNKPLPDFTGPDSKSEDASS